MLKVVVSLRPSRRFVLVSALSTVVMSLSCCQLEASASTIKTYPAIHAELNGKNYPAILVGKDTYIQWGALKVFKTPYQSLGNGRFALTGKTVQGITYKGTTYIPWSDVAPKVKAIPVRAGFNFTSLPVSHNYRMNLQASDTQVSGSSVTFMVKTADGSRGVPHQALTIDETTYGAHPTSHHTIAFTNADGVYSFTVNGHNTKTIVSMVTWHPPTGRSLTEQKAVKITDPSTNLKSTSSGTPSSSSGSTSKDQTTGESIVTTVPISTIDDGVYFKATANGQPIQFQLDTGAFEMLLTKSVAESLHLPNLGDLSIVGVGGQDVAYQSQASINIGGVQFNNVPCVVDDNYTGTPLFGYRFFVDKGYDLLVSQTNSTMTILK